MKSIVIAILLSAVPLAGCSVQPTKSVPSRRRESQIALPISRGTEPARAATLVGTVIEKPWGETYESYNAGGGAYYVLDVRERNRTGGSSRIDTQVVPPIRRTAGEGVILRASKRVRFEDFPLFKGKRVEVRGAYLPGKPWKPPPDYEGVYLLPTKNPRTGKREWAIRGSGFRVDYIRVIGAKKP